MGRGYPLPQPPPQIHFGFLPENGVLQCIHKVRPLRFGEIYCTVFNVASTRRSFSVGYYDDAAKQTHVVTVQVRSQSPCIAEALGCVDYYCMASSMISIKGRRCPSFCLRSRFVTCVAGISDSHAECIVCISAVNSDNVHFRWVFSFAKLRQNICITDIAVASALC